MKHNKVINNFKSLQILANADNHNKYEIKQLLNSASNILLKSIQECAVNILAKNVPLSRLEYDYLFKYKSAIRSISSAKSVLKLKRILLLNYKHLPNLIRPVLKLFKATSLKV